MVLGPFNVTNSLLSHTIAVFETPASTNSTQVLIPRGESKTAVHLKNVYLSRPRLHINNNIHHIQRAFGFINSVKCLYSINLLLT